MMSSVCPALTPPGDVPGCGAPRAPRRGRALARTAARSAWPGPHPPGTPCQAPPMHAPARRGGITSWHLSAGNCTSHKPCGGGAPAREDGSACGYGAARGQRLAIYPRLHATQQRIGGSCAHLQRRGQLGGGRGVRGSEPRRGQRLHQHQQAPGRLARAQQHDLQAPPVKRRCRPASAGALCVLAAGCTLC